MGRHAWSAVAAVLGAAAVVATTSAVAGGDDGKRSFGTQLDGYSEIVGGPGPDSGSVSTLARGSFRARLKSDPPRLEYTLSYSDIEGGGATQAHFHFAQQHVGGGVISFLCGGPKPACPATGGSISGTVTAADVIGPANQGIGAGSFDELVRALRAGAVYVNVHSSGFPEGEIRGQVSAGDEDD